LDNHGILAKWSKELNSQNAPKGALDLIVATSIYYFDINNMTHHSLDLRSSLDNGIDIPYPQNGNEYVKLYYDMEAYKDNTTNSTLLHLFH